MFLAITLCLSSLVAHASSKQYPLVEEVINGWSIELSTNWRVLGPFSQHAREQHFISPSYPLNVSNGERLDFSKEYYSSLAPTVHWENVTSHQGHINLEFPNIRWEDLRLSEGWAVLQHHALLHSELLVTPSCLGEGALSTVPVLLANVRQMSFFTIVPENYPSSFTPTWYSGNIYNLPNTPAHLIELPLIPSQLGPTKYHVFASGDYEIRLFGDPKDIEGQTTPIQRLAFELSAVEQRSATAVRLDPKLDVFPDFIDGWALALDGSMGVGVYNDGGGWWEVTAVQSIFSDSIKISSEVVRLAPHQSRILPIRLVQITPYLNEILAIDLRITPCHSHSSPVLRGRAFTLRTSITLSHKQLWKTGSDEAAYKASYSLGSMPLYFMIKPPQRQSLYAPVILALHGAGVEASSTFWVEAIKRQKNSWIVFPTGRTSWGFDWHGPSTLDVWGCFKALGSILHMREDWDAWATREARVVLVGHSNGGQGVWYQAERFPDRVLAAVPAAAYIKSQAYVSLAQSRAGHFIDASLRGILESALQPDDNDLFLTNLVSTPLMAIHGANDRNVPTWHSRQLVELLRTRYGKDNLTLYEVPNVPHWWDTVFANEMVQAFLDDATGSNLRKPPLPTRFILTIAIPEESGSLHGFQIERLETPGRIGRLKVNANNESLTVTTTNVWEYSFMVDSQWSGRKLITDGIASGVPQSGVRVYLSKQNGKWQTSASPSQRRPSGPLNRILVNEESLTIVIPKDSTRYLSAAKRIAHDLLSYLRIDSLIVHDHDAIRQVNSGTFGCSNLVVIGGEENAFGKSLMTSSPVPIAFLRRGWTLGGQTFNSSGLGLAFLHPHPTCEMSLSLFMVSTDDAGLERILRLFPLRTGVSVPEWIITGPATDTMGAGGLLGAGYWDRDWGWSDTQSWMGFN